jgi:hypothetical protein
MVTRNALAAIAAEAIVLSHSLEQYAFLVVIFAKKKQLIVDDCVEFLEHIFQQHQRLTK